MMQQLTKQLSKGKLPKGMGGFGGYDALAHALQEAQTAAQQEPSQPPVQQPQGESGVAT